jgi:cell wall-associated NlpC family hydrolase
MLAALAAGMTTAATLSLAPPAGASGSPGGRILDIAETRAGDWYSYGSAGPYAFDCSGLVWWAARQAGITLPRTSYGMAAGSAHLEIIPLDEAERGDILVYPGDGHVEFKTDWHHGSFGAEEPGTRVGWHTWNAYWHPVFALRVIG